MKQHGAAARGGDVTRKDGVPLTPVESESGVLLERIMAALQTLLADTQALHEALEREPAAKPAQEDVHALARARLASTSRDLQRLLTRLQELVPADGPPITAPRFGQHDRSA